MCENRFLVAHRIGVPIVAFERSIGRIPSNVAFDDEYVRHEEAVEEDAATVPN